MNIFYYKCKVYVCKYMYKNTITYPYKCIVSETQICNHNGGDKLAQEIWVQLAEASIRDSSF